MRVSKGSGIRFQVTCNLDRDEDFDALEAFIRFALSVAVLLVGHALGSLLKLARFRYSGYLPENIRHLTKRVK